MPNRPPDASGSGRATSARATAHDELARERLAAIVEWSDDAIVSKDLSGTIKSWNRGAERMFGYSAEEMIGRSILVIIPPDRHAEEQTVLDRILSGQTVDHFETMRLRRDGTLVDVSITVSPVRDGAGTVVGASKIARDITDRRRHDRDQQHLLERERTALAKATEHRDRLAFLSEVTAGLGSSLDYEKTLDNAVHLALPRLGDYCTVLVQDDTGTLRLVGCGHVIREREAIVRSISERFVEQRTDVPTFTADILRTGRARIVPRVFESAEARQVLKSRPDLLPLGDLFKPCSYVGVPLRITGGILGVMAFGTTTDLSNREYGEADLPLVEEFARQVSLSLENARLFRQAGELNRLKDEFLATLSHELRTPLNAIIGWSRLLTDGRLNDDAMRRAVIAIERNANAQAKIVDDILDVARGVAGNLKLEMTPLDFVEVAQRGVDAILPSAAAKHIEIDLVASAAAVPVTGDAGRLAQVVGNLLSNGVKFTPDGGHLRVDVRERDGWATLSVVDTGIGIPAAFLPHVFDKFRQADGSYTRRYGGLGLGLAIARHLVELHEGTIEAHSEGKNLGSTFIVRLPIERR